MRVYSVPPLRSRNYWLDGDPASFTHARQNSRSGSVSFGPALHIDIQIHISPEASAAQIEQIFASMAKHVYGRSTAE
jgi:hypothetical protein